MSAEIVNLRRARKAHGRLQKEARAAENRAQFGRTKAARQLDAAREQHARRLIEDHKIEAPNTVRRQGMSPRDTET